MAVATSNTCGAKPMVLIATAMTVVPTSATGPAPKRRISGAGNHDATIEPSAIMAITTPNSVLLRPNASLTSG